MSSKVKVGGAWRMPQNLAIKVDGTWRNAKYGYIKIAGSWVKWFTALITDNFNRTTSGSLGTSTSGTLWSAIRGTWFANNGVAQSDDAPSSYPIAAVEVGDNAVVSASVNPGTGLAFWVTDSNSWWASEYFRTESSYSYVCGSTPCGSYACGTYTPYAGSYPSCNCGVTQSVSGVVCNTQYASGLDSSTASAVCCGGVSSSTSYSCPFGGTLSGSTCFLPASSSYIGCGVGPAGACADTGGSYSGCYCNYPASSYAATPSTTYSCYTGYTTTYSYSCTACAQQTSYCTSYCDVSCTGTSYSHYIRIIKSEGGVVSTVGSDYALSSAAAAFVVATSNNNIQVSAYLDSSMASPIGTLNTTAVSPVRGTKVGIIKAPTDSGQSSVIDNFTATT